MIASGSIGLIGRLNPSLSAWEVVAWPVYAQILVILGDYYHMPQMTLIFPQGNWELEVGWMDAEELANMLAQLSLQAQSDWEMKILKSRV